MQQRNGVLGKEVELYDKLPNGRIKCPLFPDYNYTYNVVFMHGITARIDILISCFCYNALATHESADQKGFNTHNILYSISP
jgi:hypothetical protein